MKLTKEITKIEKSAVKLTITVPKKEAVNEYNTIVGKYSKTLLIPGFRKGHVPQTVLERKLGDALKKEVSGELIEKALTEVFEEIDEKPLPYSQPRLENEPKFDTGADFSFTVSYDVFPSVTVGGCDGITVKEPQVTIGKAEIDEQLKQIQERNALVLDKKEDEAAASGDIVTITYFEVDDKGKEVADSKREDFVLTIGSGNVLQFDDDLIGMKKGGTKKVVKTYGDDVELKTIAGKTITYNITVTAIKIRNLPALDDELAQDVSEKYKTLADLTKSITKELEEQKTDRIRELKITSLLEQLVERNPVELPESMVQAQLEAQWQRFMGQFGNADPKEIEKSFGSMKDGAFAEWRTGIEQQLKSRLIVESLLKEKNVTCSPEELEAEYARIAERMEVSVDEVKKQYTEASHKEYLADEVKERKLYDGLFSEIKIEKGDKISFKALFEEHNHDHEHAHEHHHDHAGDNA